MKPEQNPLKIPGAKLGWMYAAIFVLLGLGYSILTPIFENSDETLHYPYVKHLADGQGLPLAIPGQLWNQEGTQPPLYYAIVAATTFWINTDNLRQHLQLNPHWLFTEVRLLLNDNQNRVLHGPMDALPYRRAALAIHIGRWWSLLFGVVTVLCTFAVVRHLVPNNLPLALTATALVTLTPQFLRVSATVSNDSLSAALAALTVLLALKFTAPSRPFTSRHALLLGLLSGLALLTKLSSLSTLFLATAVILWQRGWVRTGQRGWPRLFGWLLLMTAVTAALNGWWFWRNYQLYGEWLATDTHLDLAGRGYLSPFQIWELRTEIERAYWATFGWGQIRLPEGLYRLLGGFSRVGLAALLLALIAKLARPNQKTAGPLQLDHIRLDVVLFLLFWAGLNLALYLRWITEVGSVSHTRLIFPAITAISLLLAMGWHALLPRRVQGWFSGLLTVTLLSLNIYSLGWLIRPAFAPPNSPLPPAASPLDLTFLDSMRLTAGYISPGPNPAITDRRRGVTAGDAVSIQTRWQILQPMANTYSVSAVLLAPDGSVLAQRQTYPGLGLRPTQYLQAGSSFSDLYPLSVTTPLTEPFVARAVVTLFDLDSPTRAGFPALDTAGSKVTPVVGHIKLAPDPWPQYRPAHLVRVNFGGQIQLTGFDLSTDSDAPQLILYWQSLAPVDENLNLFVHLLDSSGSVIAQADAPPTQNAYPTSWWSPGEIIADQHRLPQPDVDQTTAIRLGLYSLATGQRLPVLESSLPTQDNGAEIPLP